MKRILIICLLLLGIFLPTFAKNWLEIGNKTYIDTDSIEQYVDDYGNIQRTQYTLWLKRLNDNSELFKNLEKLHSKKIHYVLSKEMIDIKTKRLASKTIVLYGIDGHVVDSFECKDLLLEWHSIIPDTVGDVEFEIVREYINR